MFDVRVGDDFYRLFHLGAEIVIPTIFFADILTFGDSPAKTNAELTTFWYMHTWTTFLNTRVRG